MGIVAVACGASEGGSSGSASEVRPVQVLSADVGAAPGELVLVLASCNRTVNAEIRRQGAYVVNVAGAAGGGEGTDGDDCADTARIALDEPLGGRLVVDTASDLAVPITGSGLGAGDFVSILMVRPLGSAPSADLASVAATLAELTDEWRRLELRGPAPGIDFETDVAVLVRSAGIVGCLNSAATVQLKGDVLEIGAQASRASDVCVQQDAGHVVALKVPRERGLRIDTVVRGSGRMEVPLKPADG